MRAHVSSDEGQILGFCKSANNKAYIVAGVRILGNACEEGQSLCLSMKARVAVDGEGFFGFWSR